ncbi:MAG: ImmA/IrrE family metallo-endopeptidase [Terracidiphilus sp.]|nr:ImmA/IrrE family metallo-endopeptidase [Terracidiphilus sp.]
MSRNDYYEQLKSLARLKRIEFGVRTQSFGLRELRQIYKFERIRIDTRPFGRKLKALYMCDGGDCSVGIQQGLPVEPKLFALVHELKHHYVDREALGQGVLPCCDYNQNELIEKGAEVFAAEFIYPEQEFKDDAAKLSISTWTAEDIVRFKRSTTAKTSYQFLCKRLTRLGFIRQDEFKKTAFKKLEEEMYGVPFRRSRS